MSADRATSVSWDQLEDWPAMELGDEHPWPSTDYLTLRVYSTALGCSHTGFSIGRVDPGQTVEHHRHFDGEEVYVLLRGSCQIRLGDEVVEAKELDAFRFPPSVFRSVYNHSDSPCWWLFFGAPPGQGGQEEWGDSAQGERH